MGRVTLQCGTGWYGLLIELDAKIASICPGYVIDQVKEKFGTLRFYISPPSVSLLPCCADMTIKQERARDDNEEAGIAFLLERHQAGEEHAEALRITRDYIQMFEDGQDAIYEIIREYEILSGKCCEECGEPGVLSDNGGWYRTLCPECAEG